MLKPILSFCALVTLAACRSADSDELSISLAFFTQDSAAIVFSIERGETCALYKANIADGAKVRLTKGDPGCESDPSFSADGQGLVFVKAAKRGEHGDVTVSRSDGSDARVLVSSGEDNLSPVFVPHSKRVVFLRSGAFEHYSPLVGDRRHKFDLYVADIGSGKVSALTQEKFYEINHVSVSADGRQALLSVNGDHFLAVPLGQSQLSTRNFQPNVAGGPKSPVLYNGEWLPDGNFLFSAATEPPGGGNFNYNIYRFNTTSSAIEQLTNLKGELGGFAVANDGRRAVILHEGTYVILDLSTRRLTPVPLKIE